MKKDGAAKESCRPRTDRPAIQKTLLTWAGSTILEKSEAENGLRSEWRKAGVWGVYEAATDIHMYTHGDPHTYTHTHTDTTYTLHSAEDKYEFASRPRSSQGHLSRWLEKPNISRNQQLYPHRAKSWVLEMRNDLCRTWCIGRAQCRLHEVHIVLS